MRTSPRASLVRAFESYQNDGHEQRLMRRRRLVKVVPMLLLSVLQMIPIQNWVPPLAKKLKETMPNVTVILQGHPPKDLEPVYREAGVDDFISVRANCYEILNTLQDKEGM